MPSDVLLRSYAQCNYAECHYDEYHYAECRYAECLVLFIAMLNAECFVAA